MTTNELVTTDGGALSIQALNEQIQLIQHHMREHMKEGEHFGKIPGCGDKPALFKSGAEKLTFIFRLVPEYQVTTTPLGGEHREFTVSCTIRRMGSDVVVGRGLGSCSTAEKKYRWRSENTGKEVPRDYWKERNVELLGGAQYTPRKLDGKWIIFHQVENKDIADVYNTVLKMAKKRAYIDATIQALAASDIFAQDIDDDFEPEVKPKKEADDTTGKPQPVERSKLQEYVINFSPNSEFNGLMLCEIDPDFFLALANQPSLANQFEEQDLVNVREYYTRFIRRASKTKEEIQEEARQKAVEQQRQRLAQQQGTK